MKIKILLLLFAVYSSNLIAQSNLSETQNELYKKIPQENIYLHFNNNLLITGDRLTYKVYCLYNNTTKLSSLSKIAYVEIINSDNETILKQKVMLDNGLGYGDFLINSEIKTSNYKIISYTQWMKNKNFYFSDNLAIYNAFNTPPKFKNDSTTNQLNIKSNLKTYTTRSKVNIPLDIEKKGSYSINVQKVSLKRTSNKINFINTQINANSLIKENTDHLFIPEFRGELIQGKISVKNNRPIENIKIGLSISEYNGITKITSTNSEGLFYFNIDKRIDKKSLYFSVLNDYSNDYTLDLVAQKKLNLIDLKIEKDITSNNLLNKVIAERSIYLQIENAYQQHKQDSIIAPIIDKTYWQENATTYHLDDYKRFNTMKETFVEVINDAWITEDKNDKAMFHVRDENLDSNSLLKPLIIINGYLLNNNNLLVDLHPKKVKTIYIDRKKHVFNSMIFQGVIYVDTFNQEFIPFESKQLELQNVTPLKKYYSPNYNSDNLSRIPDFRTQLYWNPSLSGEESEVSFFTSDNKGFYLVEIEGISFDGKPYSHKEYFEVK
jgi:hypothetical protein